LIFLINGGERYLKDLSDMNYDVSYKDLEILAFDT